MLNPPPHPLPIQLLRLINQPQIQQQLHRSPHSRMQGRTHPRMRRRRVLSDEDRVVLDAMIRRDVQFVLLDVRPTPRRRGMFVLQPAQPLIVPRVQIARLLAVQRDDGIQDGLHVLLVRERDESIAPVTAAVLDYHTRPGLIVSVHGVV